MIVLIFSLNVSSPIGISSVDYLIAEYNRIQMEILYEKEFNLFASHLGFRESNNNWKIINPINCIGEYQFHYKTLERIGFNVDPDEFKCNPDIFPPEMQYEALKALIKVNRFDLRHCESYVGSSINGIEITVSGLLAGTHLGGIRSVRIFLESGGVIDRQDMYGTKISDYIKEFSIYKL